MKTILQDSEEKEHDGQTRSHIIDSMFFGNGFSTEEARLLVSDTRRMQRWLDVEVALAKTLASFGIIPQSVAQTLEETGKIDNLDLAAIKKEIQLTQHSLIPLLHSWQEIVDNEVGQYIHYGATTQDIQDTAQALEIKDFIDVIQRDLGVIIKALTHFTQNYRDIPMVGRTHGQHALPSTLGIKIAGWLDETIRNYERLERCKETVLVSQLFGGVGNLSAFSKGAISLIRRFSEELGLHTSNTSWHSARDRIVEFVTILALITGGIGRIANEILQLAKDEIKELGEPFNQGTIGSSTMPHKRNPENCERIIALSKLVKGNASLSFDTLQSEHERDYRTIRMEWVTLTDSCLYTCCALDLMKPICKNLVVYKENMMRNLNDSIETISSEAIMFAIGKRIGKQSAHNLVYNAAMRGVDKGTSLVEELLETSLIRKYFTEKDLKDVVLNAAKSGLAGELVDHMVDTSKKKFGFTY